MDRRADRPVQAFAALAIAIGVLLTASLAWGVAAISSRIAEETFARSSRAVAQYFELDLERTLARHEFQGDVRKAKAALDAKLQSYSGLGVASDVRVTDASGVVVSSFREDVVGTVELCVQGGERLIPGGDTVGHATEGPRGEVDPRDQSLCTVYPLRQGGRVVGGLVFHQRVEGIVPAAADLTVRLGALLALGLALLYVVLGTGAAVVRQRLRRLEAARARDERFAALGHVSAALAHEVRNPLNAIAVSLGAVSEALAAEGPPLGGERLQLVRRRTEAIDREVRRLRALLEDFVQTGRRPEVHLVPDDVAAVVRETAELLRPEIEGAGARLEVDAKGPLRARIDPPRVAQVVKNLVKNSVEALGARTRVEPGCERRVRVAARPDDGGARVRVDVEDTGQGIPVAIRSHLFEPYSSTKANGLGLGLALSRGIAEAHGGQLLASDREGGGARFTLLLPAAAAEG